MSKWPVDPITAPGAVVHSVRPGGRPAVCTLAPGQPRVQELDCHGEAPGEEPRGPVPDSLSVHSALDEECPVIRRQLPSYG